jgi:hypothetical protein
MNNQSLFFGQAARLQFGHEILDEKEVKQSSFDHSQIFLISGRSAERKRRENWWCLRDQNTMEDSLPFSHAHKDMRKKLLYPSVVLYFTAGLIMRGEKTNEGHYVSNKQQYTGQNMNTS